MNKHYYQGCKMNKERLMLFSFDIFQLLVEWHFNLAGTVINVTDILATLPIYTKAKIFLQLMLNVGQEA